MGLIRALWAGVCLTLLGAVAPGPAMAQEGLRAVARVLPDASRVSVADRGAGVDLALTQAVPWRVYTLADPARAVLEFREVSFAGVTATDLGQGATVRFGPVRPGWSRFVVELPGPMAVRRAGMETNPETGEATVTLRLTPTDLSRFLASAGAPEMPGWPSPAPLGTDQPPRPRQSGDRPLVIVLDPGHGGIDPGAERGGVREADLMLTFARELRDLLILEGGMEVHLTRDEDVFVSLPRRVSFARSVGADAFLSLHADALAAGRATGATVYVLSDSGADKAAQQLAAQQDRSDLLAGVDLRQRDDEVAQVLIDLARIETAARSERLAQSIVAGLSGTLTDLYKEPLRRAGFSVLRAPDIPSVLVEMGFLSEGEDRARLIDPAWRAEFAQAILSALLSWGIEDAAEAQLLRQ